MSKGEHKYHFDLCKKCDVKRGDDDDEEDYMFTTRSCNCLSRLFR